MALRKIALVAAVTALIWTACCLSLARRIGFPAPAVHDEFSYLLGADTFLHGRLANPEHPLGPFFKSPHVLISPKYASKYPPGQSLFLALGRKVFGSPYYGVLLSGAVMIFLLTMTLVAWSSPVPGLAVSFLFCLFFLPPMYWVYSYWGGCVAAAGATAVLLAVDLFRRGHPIAAGLAFSPGGFTLFLTRPAEGGMFTIAVLAVSGFWFWRRREQAAVSGMRAFLLSAAPVIIAGALWTGWYNLAVTGNPFELPHLLDDAQYATTPLFWFLPAHPEPHYSSPRLAAVYGRSGEDFKFYRQEQAGGFYRAVSDTLGIIFRVFAWTLLPLVLVIFAWRDWRVRWLGAVVVISFLGLCLQTFHLAHYDAPLIVAMALLSACAAERVWRIRIRSVPAGALLTYLVFGAACTLQASETVESFRARFVRLGTFGFARADLIRRLSEIDGEHLVIVRYPDPAWRNGEEWVYNGADIDSLRIVFAHDLGDTENEKLLQYYPARRAWLLTFDDTRFHLAPYLPGRPGL